MSYNPQHPPFEWLGIDRKAMLADPANNYDTKKACFIPDEKEGFVVATIESSKGEEITVKTESGVVSVSLSDDPYKL